jgi:NhaA family Na+:H+ antiporter
MLGCALLGIMLANLPATANVFALVAHTHIGIPATNVDMPVGSWAQNGLLTVFFLVVGLDLKQELTTGTLSNPRTAAVPMLSAVGGMLVPPVLFLLIARAVYSAQLGDGTDGASLAIAEFNAIAQGWAIPTATDIAFSLAVLSLFARALPCSIRAFLMTLATVDDLLGIIVIAAFFSHLNEWYWFAGLALCAFFWFLLVRLRHVPWIAVGLVGIAAWIMMFEAGVHPTLAGVMVGLLTPAIERNGEATPRAARYRDRLQPLSALVALPIFAMFATGVHFDTFTPALFVSPIALGIVVALVVGKPLGIMATSWICTHLARLNLPEGLRVRNLFPMSCACGIGFTVSFLIASLAYGDAAMVGESRIGILLASLLSAALSGVLLHRQSKILGHVNSIECADDGAVETIS